MDGTAGFGSRWWWATGAVMVFVAALLVVITQSWVGATQSDGERPVLVPISPCRLADTRVPIGPNGTLGPDSTVTIVAHGTNGQCTIPSDAVALSMNVTTLNATAQVSLPNRLRARGMSCYVTSIAVSMSLGSLLWGNVAGSTDLMTAQKIAAATLVVTAAVSLKFHLGKSLT